MDNWSKLQNNEINGESKIALITGITGQVSAHTAFVIAINDDSYLLTPLQIIQRGRKF